MNQPQTETARNYAMLVRSPKSVPALIEWTADNRIRLSVIDPKTPQVKTLVFECSPNQLSKVNAINTQWLSFRYAGEKYQLDFSHMDTSLLATSSVFGELTTASLTSTDGGVKTGADWWLDKLREQGVKVDNLDMTKTLVITFATIIAFIVAGLIAAVIVHLVDPNHP